MPKKLNLSFIFQSKATKIGTSIVIIKPYFMMKTKQ